MDSIIKFLEITFTPLVFLFTVSNLGAMGLQVRLPEVKVILKNKKSLAQIFFWGWLAGPAFGYFITWVLPLAEPFAFVILLSSLAPCAPFLQQMVGRGKGDMAFAGAMIPIVALGTVIFMPILGPLLIKGLTISTWAIAKPLLLTILFPLAIGAAIRHYSEAIADKFFKVVKIIALVTPMVTILSCLVLYGSSILDTAGSFALLSMTLFMAGMGFITYRLGIGLKQNQRTVMALGMGTRNIAAVLAAALAIPNADPRIVTMVIMWTIWSIILAAIAAKIFAKQSDKAAAANIQ